MTTWDALPAEGLPPGCRVAEAHLANGLKAVIAEVPTARQSRLALGVGVGYLDEPAAYPGLAHLLEHALFLGSRHEPQSADFASWVGERGGRYNARTDDQVTDYHLTLPPDATAEGLERLLALVTAPRFQIGTIEREVNVLDAEFQARLADPALHRQAALSRLFCVSHPARLCHAGNRATLGDDGASLCKALGDFHERYYRAELMALVMLAPLPLGEQQALIEAAVTRLATGGSPPRRTWRWADTKSTSETEAESGTEPEPQGICWVSPTGERTLEMLWSIPPQATLTQRRLVERIVTALTNGELAATLAKSGWLHDLSATTTADAAGNALSLTLNLTEAGSDNTATILATSQAAVLALAKRRANSLADSPPTQAVDLTRWPLEQVRKRARERSIEADDDPLLDSCTHYSTVAGWLAPHRCRVLEAVGSLVGESLQVPVTRTYYQPRTALPAEDVKPLALLQPPMLKLRPLASLEPQAPLRCLSRDHTLTLWHGGGLLTIEASLCLGWPSDATSQQGRLQQWHRRCLVLRQTAASQSVALTLGGDAQGDWLIVRGQAALLESVATWAIECWPREANDSEPQASGLIAQRLLARLETPGASAEIHDAPRQCWVAGLSSADAKTMVGRLNATLSRRLAGLHGAAAIMRDAPAADSVHRLPSQGDDYAVMLQIDARDDTPASRLYFQLLMHCHDAAFFQDMRHRRGLGYAAAVRYREAGGWPRLGYVVQSPHADVTALQRAIRDFLSIQGTALARLDTMSFERRREALRATVGPPETDDEALLEQWQALRCGAGAYAPWQTTLDTLERIDTQGLIECAETLVNGVLRWCWWVHEPTDTPVAL